MAGIFKNLDQSDVRVTPFRAYKRFSTYTTYSAVLDPKAEDLGNNPLVPVSGSDFTTNYILKNSVWNSIDSQYFRYYYNNAKASFGQINYVTHPRYLRNEAVVISMPQSKFGEGIEPTSFTFATNGSTVVDDAYGNLITTTPTQWTVGGEISSSNIVFSLKPSIYTKQLTKTLSNSFLYGSDFFQSTVTLNNIQVTSSTYETVLQTTKLTGTTSSIVVVPNGDKLNELFNFPSKNYTITLSYVTSSGASSCVLVEKKAVNEIIRIDQNGSAYRQPIFRYPYRLTHVTESNKIFFEKSNGVTTLLHTSSFTYDQAFPLALQRSGSTYSLFNGNNTSSFTDTLNTQEAFCMNKANIYIGADEFGNSGSSATFGNLYFYNTALTKTQYNSLTSSFGFNNPYHVVGMLSRKQGLAVITDASMISDIKSTGISTLEYRGTTTIYENEYSCTISPGEFNFTNNPTAQYYNEVRNQFELSDFATGSSFIPYVTRVGLYNDSNDLLVIGTLSHPIQPPQNVDTTFILRYDM